MTLTVWQEYGGTLFAAIVYLGVLIWAYRFVESGLQAGPTTEDTVGR